MPERELTKRIAERAYEIWESEGQPEGRSEQHWNQARAEFAEAKSEAEAAPQSPAVATKTDPAPKAARGKAGGARAAGTARSKGSR